MLNLLFEIDGVIKEKHDEINCHQKPKCTKVTLDLSTCVWLAVKNV